VSRSMRQLPAQRSHSAHYAGECHVGRAFRDRFGQGRHASECIHGEETPPRADPSSSRERPADIDEAFGVHV
jgi:hypothetical protein